MKKAVHRQPLVSVIIASMNNVTTLQRCIDSFSAQTYEYKQLLIIDGASTDGSEEILRKNNQVINYWESEPDRGIAHAWNKALKNANGEWIIFIGSDDTFADSTVLEEFSRKISGYSLNNGKIIYGKIKIFLPEGGYLDTQGMDWQAIRAVFFSEKMMIPHPACFHHHSVFMHYGLFDEEFSIAVDYEFLLRVLRNEEAVFLPDFVVTNMTFGGLSSRVVNLLAMQRECDKALKKHGVKPTGYKRALNVFIYQVLGVVIKYGGEQMAARLLDTIRVILGKDPVWTRK